MDDAVLQRANMGDATQRKHHSAQHIPLDGPVHFDLPPFAAEQHSPHEGVPTQDAAEDAPLSPLSQDTPAAIHRFADQAAANAYVIPRVDISGFREEERNVMFSCHVFLSRLLPSSKFVISEGKVMYAFDVIDREKQIYQIGGAIVTEGTPKSGMRVFAVSQCSSVKSLPCFLLTPGYEVPYSLPAGVKTKLCVTSICDTPTRVCFKAEGVMTCEIKGNDRTIVSARQKKMLEFLPFIPRSSIPRRIKNQEKYANPSEHM
jgi:hypothetical protein